LGAEVRARLLDGVVVNTLASIDAALSGDAALGDEPEPPAVPRTQADANLETNSNA
jgi:hypothetical protein